MEEVKESLEGVVASNQVFVSEIRDLRGINGGL